MTPAELGQLAVRAVLFMLAFFALLHFIAAMVRKIEDRRDRQRRAAAVRSQAFLEQERERWNQRSYEDA